MLSSSAFLRRSQRWVRLPVGAACMHTSQALWAHKVLKHFKLADVGEGITECEVIKWYVHL